MLKRALLIGALAIAGCATGAPEVIDANEQAIVDGTRETGRPEVVLLFSTRGSSCTASIISPYVVLTAYHCVVSGSGPAAPSSFRVYVGSSQRQLTAEYRVREVRPVPGASFGGRNAGDVALLVLSTPARETPLELGLEDPTIALSGQSLTAVGFGQTPTGGSLTKYTTDTRMTYYQTGYIFVPPTVCQGDSGGPLIGPAGRVWGVASFITSPDGRTEPQCGTAPGAYNEIYRYLDFINSVLEENGSCIPSPSGEETCDGTDDDCDEMVDEGCIPLGDPCAASDECVGGLCADTAAGRICTTECDGLRPEEGCGPGFFCAADGCNGYCVRGERGMAGNGADCTANTDCASLFCLDPGDGRQRCLDPCRGDAGLCYAGEVCAANPGECGGCVDAGIVAGQRGLGEACDTDDECRGDMVCQEYAGIRECARPCDSDESCGEGFECRDGLCRLDRRQGVGGTCAENPDCGDGVCASAGARSWCTAQCASEEDCPEGFGCQDAGGVTVCAPELGLDGDACMTSDDCASGLCATADGMSFCTSWCDRRTPCGAGFECQRTGGETAACVPVTEATESGGGCAVEPREPAPVAPLGLVGLALLGWLYRRSAR